jgi:hypothetical protein
MGVREEKYMEKYKSQRDWLKTDEGKAYLETLKPYETLDEFYSDLSEIKPVDYTSAETTMEDAVAHSRKVLEVLVRAENLDLYSEQKNVSEALKMIGCVPFPLAHEKFQDRSTIGELLYKESVSFPLSAYQQLIDASPATYRYGWAKLKDGGAEYSWLGEWLFTQQMAEQARANQKQ